MKKLLAVFLCVAMLMSFVTLVASANDSQAVAVEETAIGSVLTEDGEGDGSTLGDINFWGFLQSILNAANWTNVIAILIQTIGTIADIFSKLG